MKCTPSPLGLAALFVFLFFVAAAIVLVRRQWTRRDKDWRIAVHHEASIEAAKLLKDWCAWLATISTAAIAANGFLAPGNSNICGKGAFAMLAILAFLMAIVATATLLLALPSVLARFNREEADPKNDFYESQAFVWATTSAQHFTPLFRVGFIASVQYICFVLGVFSFAVHATLRYADL